MHSRRELFNGMIAGAVTPFIFYFILKGIDMFIATGIIENWYNVAWSGFSLKFYCVVSIVSNIIPFQVFNRQERMQPMQGVVMSTFILIGVVLYVFRSEFYGWFLSWVAVYLILSDNFETDDWGAYSIDMGRYVHFVSQNGICFFDFR